MSSSSSYHPEESEDASDSEFETRRSTTTRSSAVPSSRSHDTEYSIRKLRQNTSRSERRKARNKTRETAYWDLRQQLSGESVGAYTKLLEETNSDFPPVKSEIGGSENYNVTQNGIVIWTTQEKEIFFDLLDKKGKNGIKEISQAIGTKSELEVQEHLRLLHRGLERQHLRDRHARTVILGDIPAAIEVGGDCGRELDKYSELLCLEEQYLGDIAGRKRHYNTWIVDRKKAEEIDEQIDEEDADEEEDEEVGATEDEESEEEREPLTIPTNSPVHLSANLFTMSKWIRLSERFFMNPSGSRLSDNWTKIAYPGETPSITADAFADLYSIAISLIRRLVHSSLFFAMSRIRQMRDSRGRRKARLVKSQDVRTALDVLNMKQDRSDYWIGLARRCHLDVMDARHQKGWKNVRMSHNEVEDYLSGDLPKYFDEKDKSKSRQEHTGDSIDNDSDSIISDIRSSPDPIPEEQLYLTFEDEHAEAVDQKASNIEEQRLWEVLGRSAPVDLDLEIKREGEDLETLRKPTGERKTKEDLVDWRNRTLYRGEWEEYGNEIFDVYEELSKNRRKRRRTAEEEPVVPASSVVTISDDYADVEMDEMDTRDDEETEKVNTRAIKDEGEDGSEEEEEGRDEDMDEYEESVHSIGVEEEVDQESIIRDNDEELQDQDASQDSNESEYESEYGFKPPQQAIKYDPSGDEDEDSGSESDDDHQPQKSTMKREASNLGSESESTETEQKPNISGGSQEHQQIVKHGLSKYSGSGTEFESDGQGAETEHKPKITTARDDNDSRAASNSENDARLKEDDKSTDEERSTSSNQRGRSS